MTFDIRRVDRSRAEAVETIGSKPKFWFREDDRRLLFKADDRGTGEDWAEVVACHLCQLLGLPHVDYELAEEYDGERHVRPGVICESMAPPPASLVLGNELLLAVDQSYPKQQRFKVRQHTIKAVCEILATLHPPGLEWVDSVPSGIGSALDIFTGYVMLDAWIANQDRHHENWGGIWDGRTTVRLAPTFDHGAALARNLLDAEREERLDTRDIMRQVPAFVKKGRSAFYRSVRDTKPLGLVDAFLGFRDRAAEAAPAWIERLRAVQGDDVWSILEKVPSHRMSDVAKRFTMELLMINQRRLTQ